MTATLFARLLALALSAAPLGLRAQQDAQRPASDSVRAQTFRYFRARVRASIAFERAPTAVPSGARPERLAAALQVPLVDRARMLQCTDGCADTPKYLVTVGAPSWSGDTARVTVGWLRQESATPRSRALVASGADEFLLAPRNGAWVVVGVGRRYREATAGGGGVH